MREFVEQALLRSPAYKQWSPYWITAFVAGLMMNAESRSLFWVGVLLAIVGPFIAHVVRYGSGDLWLSYKHSWACSCGNFSISTTEPEMLKKLSDIHSRSCNG